MIVYRTSSIEHRTYREVGRVDDEPAVNRDKGAGVHVALPHQNREVLRPSGLAGHRGR